MSFQGSQINFDCQEHINAILQQKDCNSEFLMNMQQHEKFLKSKLKLRMENYKAFNEEITKSYKTLRSSFSQEYERFKKDTEYLEQHQKRLADEVDEVSHDMVKVTMDVQELSSGHANTELSSKEAWMTLGQVCRKEETIIDEQNEKIGGSDDKLCCLTNVIVDKQKDALDEVAIIKKSQSEGLLGQFQKLEDRINSSASQLISEWNHVEKELKTKCKTETKSIKTFLRDKNLLLNEIQHSCYHDLRILRTDLENLVLNLNKTTRESTIDGQDNIENLRDDVVKPAIQIVTEYRYVSRARRMRI